jgi:hypothetical protein
MGTATRRHVDYASGVGFPLPASLASLWSIRCKSTTNRRGIPSSPQPFGSILTLAQFTVRMGGVIEAPCDNLAATLHKADTWAQRYREVCTIHRGDKVVATATYKHTTMAA